MTLNELKESIEKILAEQPSLKHKEVIACDVAKIYDFDSPNNWKLKEIEENAMFNVTVISMELEQ